MGEEQLPCLGFEGQGGRLCRGAVQFLGCHAGKGIVEGALKAEQVHFVDEGQEALGVARVGAIGVATGGVGAAGHLFYQVAVGGHRVEQRKGRDTAKVVLEHGLAAFGVAEFVVVHFEVEAASGGLHKGVHGMGNALGSEDADRVGAATEVHGAQQARESKEVVAVQVGEEDGAGRLQLLVTDAHLGLCVLSAVQQDAETVDVDHLPAAVAGHGGQGCSGA